MTRDPDCTRCRVMSLVLAGVSGAVFALGLLISGMTIPARVTAFLDVFAWDPTLAFVLIGALSTYALLAWQIRRRRHDPWFDVEFHWPSRTDIDAPLVIGAAVFGVGWGLSGLCPGPAIVATGAGGTGMLTFVGSMVGGMVLYSLSQRDRT